MRKPHGLAKKQAADLGSLIAPDFTCDWIASGTQDEQLMIKGAGAPVLFVRKKSKIWRLYRPPRADHIRQATNIKQLTDTVLKELGVQKASDGLD
jgi:hypothetical protein